MRANIFVNNVEMPQLPSSPTLALLWCPVIGQPSRPLILSTPQFLPSIERHAVTAPRSAAAPGASRAALDRSRRRRLRVAGAGGRAAAAAARRDAARARVYKSHRDALEAKIQAAQEEEEAEEDDDEDEEEEDDDELAAAAKANQVNGRRKNYPSKSKSAAILSDNKEWEWVPLYVASSIVKEFCFRGRFAEAIEAYASLPLTDAMRRDVVSILQDYEQYPSLLYLYEVHRSMGSEVQPLDVAPELDALKKVGRTDEMDMRFQELPVKDQSRADIQKLMGN
ncbi:unnamed protein product [Phytophthora lilii]|uniref:Unnamed protein product n=1 Tax=Phytophthora lilii TaxID=2077276 RepID=A0A9W6UA38_9STRA|nr:unnamed protein product [Phytophthora lilii]